MDGREHTAFGLLASMLAAAALSTPVSAAAADEGNALLRNDVGHFGNKTHTTTTSPFSTATPTVIVRVDGGFDWASAGVGTAGGFGLVLLAGGAASAIRRRASAAAARGH